VTIPTLPTPRLFEAYGIELEYMIVAADSLDVRPIADRLLIDAAGRVVSEVEHGTLAWSNELVLHVIELKTNGPAPGLAPLAERFQQDVREINRLLHHEHARLMPTGMHPWMNPFQEVRLWPHEYSRVYETFDRIFDCRGHGWANLQSMHINLPFQGNEEFGRLHAAVRLILPLLPGLAASSPLIDGRISGKRDTRLDVYRGNSDQIPSVAGRIIPEPVFDRAGYDREIFQPMFRDIAPFDPERILREEFLNARGAIARFSRGTIEIRLLDVQECPQADLAIATLTCESLKHLVQQTWSETRQQQQTGTDSLERILLAAIADADEAVIDDPAYLRLFGLDEPRATIGEVWTHLFEDLLRRGTVFGTKCDAALRLLLSEGCLSRRIVRALGDEPDRTRIQDLYRELCDCLDQGRLWSTS
jgi:glutamate---cysteine ligase / carboxylate-amine ligase